MLQPPSITRCHSCGAWDIDSRGKCLYCGCPVLPNEIADPNVGSVVLEGVVNDWVKNTRYDLLRNLAFLNEQLKLTGHSSINQKIANVELKLRRLEALESKVDGSA